MPSLGGERLRALPVRANHTQAIAAEPGFPPHEIRIQRATMKLQPVRLADGSGFTLAAIRVENGERIAGQ
jgi:hypothetical protein